jgi:ATP-dependent helicase/nuclease subunit B
MALSVRVVRVGPDAIAALVDEIAVAQRDDPLQPVTVVVRRSPVGLALRRHLAGLGSGVVNVRFATLARLADDLAGPALAVAGRQPASRAVVAAAVRAALDDVTSGAFRAVRHHPATERAVVALVHDLAAADDAALHRLSRLGSRPTEVARLVTDVRRRLSPWYLDHDAIVAAADIVERDPRTARAGLGHVLVHLPTTLGIDERRLVRALADALPVVVLVGATGDAAADEPVAELAERLRPGTASTFPAGEVVSGTAVVASPSADSEALLALRGVMQRNRDGVALERIAVVHGGAEPYPRLLHESFALAGIPTNGAGVRPLASTMAGRTLLGALALPDHEWRRDDVIGWLSGGPLHDAEGPVPATQFDRVSRRAGIVAGLDQWTDHLAAHALAVDERVARLAERDDEEVETDAARARLTDEQSLTRRLAALVDTLAGELEPSSAPATWVAWASWARRFMRERLRLPDETTDVDLSDERQAQLELDEVLGRLSVLDAVDPGPDMGRFRRALEHELSAPAPRTSRFGRGVLVGPVESVVGLDLDVLFVVGMREGAFPSRARDDALLPDDERAVASSDLPLRNDRARHAHATYLAALAAAPERVLSFSRGDQRRGRAVRPSRWLLDTLGHLVGDQRRLFSRDLDTLGDVAGWTSVPSMVAAVRSPLEPASAADHDLRSLLDWFEHEHHLDGHPLVAADPVLGLGLLARHDRQRLGFTRFDGRVDRVNTPSPTDGGALAPTSLEAYAVCPRRYFMAQVLRVPVAERPEDIQRISPRDKGSLVHEILERFLARETALDRSERIRPGQRWSDAHAVVLDEIADEVFDEYVQRGLTGRTLLWELDRSAIRRDLHRFLTEDDRRRSERACVPEAVELRFGPGDATPVAVHLRDGRSLAFKGVADRIDRTDSGRVVVVDYKTGGDRNFSDLVNDPVMRGTKLQLPIYGLAARARYDEVDVRTSYWFLSEKADFKERGYDLDDASLDRFGEALEVIVHGIESGAFPARPGAEDSFLSTFANCSYCDFDPICPTDREQAWERVKAAPVLSAYVELSEGDVADQADDGGAP